MQTLTKESLVLKLLRNKKVSKKIFYVLAAIIIPAFVVWGSASVMNKDKTPNIAGRISAKRSASTSSGRPTRTGGSNCVTSTATGPMRSPPS